jgi:hypothetical protein
VCAVIPLGCRINHYFFGRFLVRETTDNRWNELTLEYSRKLVGRSVAKGSNGWQRVKKKITLKKSGDNKTLFTWPAAKVK